MFLFAYRGVIFLCQYGFYISDSRPCANIKRNMNKRLKFYTLVDVSCA